MGSRGEGMAPSLRFSDLHSPNILPILGVPTLPPPPRIFYEDELEVIGADNVADEAILDSVIKLLNEADVSNLRLLDTPVVQPNEPTDLIAAVMDKDPDVFDISKTITKANLSTQKGRKGSKRLSEANTTPQAFLASPAQPVPAPPTGGSTPGTASIERVKRARTSNVSLKLSITATEKQAVAPTVAQEAITAAQSLATELDNFCRRYAYVLLKNDDVDEDEAERNHSGVEGEQDMDGGGDANKLIHAQKMLLDVRKIGDNTFIACSTPGTINQVPRSVLEQGFRVLRAIIDASRHMLLEQGDEESDTHVVNGLASLEASTIALRLIVTISNSPEASHHVISEEVLECAVDAARFQMQHNILPFHDARLRGATRPTLGRDTTGEDGENKTDHDQENEMGPAKKVKKLSSTNAAQKATNLGPQIPSALLLVTDRVQAVLSLLCDLLPVVKVPTSILVSLLRSCVAAITVPALPALQTKSASLIAAIFRSHTDLRKTILDDLLTHAAPYLGSTAKSLKRHFSLAEDVKSSSKSNIQVFTAAILQIVQGCAELPTADAQHTDIVAAFGPPIKTADYFWTQCLDRLPMARMHKAETDNDFTALLQGVVADLLLAAALPEWPAAATLLLRLAATINSSRGLQHGDPIVRQTCVDLLGRVLTMMQSVDVAVREDGEWLDSLAADNGFEDPTQASQELLLKYLADRQHSASPGSAIARRFWLVRSLSEIAVASSDDTTEPEDIQTALVQTRKKAEELDAMVYDSSLDSDEAEKLTRQALKSAFSRAAPAMLSWLLEMLDPRSQAPATRAKAVKALADLASADSTVLSIPSVQAAVERSLSDDSISVREASLSLLGRHMAGDPELALALLDTVIKSAEDPGSSVRKCAIKILKESAIAVPGFPRAIDACCALLLRANDPEESVQNAIAKVFHSLWFCPSMDKGDSSGGVIKRSLEERAALLANVAAAAYDAGGPAIHLPLDTQSHLVYVLRAALSWDSRGDARGELKAGRDMSEALLESILNEPYRIKNVEQDKIEDANEDDDDATRPALLALHALAVTNANFCLPAKDPQKFLRALAPYLKFTPDSQYITEIEKRNAAERMLCVLSVVESVLCQIDRLNDSLGALADIPKDLLHIINHHRYTQVVAAACKCLAVLSNRSSVAASDLIKLGCVYYSWLQSPGQHSPGNLPRFIFILGQLCRHGADVIDRASMAGSAPLSLAACATTFGQYWKFNGPPALREQIQRCALEATGQLAIARPLSMVQSNSDARAMLNAALHRDSSTGFKLAALGSLTELLQADAESLERRQKTQLATAPGSASAMREANGRKKSSSAKKKKGRRKNGGAMDDDDDDVDKDISPHRITTAVATENGEGDSLSQSSAVLQQHWESVLLLATDNDASSMRSIADGVNIRRRVLSLMDVVLRDGLVGPWTAVPALVALCSDSGASDVAARALRLLAELSEKHPQYVDAGRLTVGLEQAYVLHCCGAVPRDVPPTALAALGTMYIRLIWSSRPRRNEFLKAILRHFRNALGGKSSSKTKFDLRLLAFVASVAGSLPLKRAEEACILIHEAAGVCGAHIDAVLAEMHALFESGNEFHDKASFDFDSLQIACQSAAALCMLLRLRNRLELAYNISADRAAAFAAAGKRKTAEEGNPVTADPSVPALELHDLCTVIDVNTKTVDVAKARKIHEELVEAHESG